MGMGSCKELIKGWYKKWMKNPNNNPWVEIKVWCDQYAVTVMIVQRGFAFFFYLMRRNAHLSRRSIHPNLKSTVYCNAIAFGGVEEWDFAWRMFKSATLASEASRLRHAMACTKVPWLLNRCVSPFMVLLLSHHEIRVNGKTRVRWTWLVSAARECPNISQHLSQLAEGNYIFLFLSFAIYSRQSYKHTSDNIQSVTEILRTCECVRVLEVRV